MNQAIPMVQSPDRNLNQTQQNIIQSLNSILKNPITNGGALLSGISLSVGETTFSTTLGRKSQGWFLTDVNGAAQIYRSQPFNDSTLTLTSDAVVTVSVYVF